MARVSQNVCETHLLCSSCDPQQNMADHGHAQCMEETRSTDQRGHVPGTLKFEPSLSPLVSVNEEVVWVCWLHTSEPTACTASPKEQPPPCSGHPRLNLERAADARGEPKPIEEASLHHQARKLTRKHARRIPARARCERGLALVGGNLAIDGEEGLYVQGAADEAHRQSSRCNHPAGEVLRSGIGDEGDKQPKLHNGQGVEHAPGDDHHEP